MYEYTPQDLLDTEPYHYMYTPYGGLGFLADYQANRQAILRALAVGGEYLGKIDHTELAVKLGPYKINGDRPRVGKVYAEVAADHSDGFDTLEILYQLAEFLLDGGDVESPLYLSWCDGFLRRFEITKRLGACYNREFRRRRGGDAPIEAYALLAFSMAHMPRGKVDLRRLNALLKLNDLLISSGQRTVGCIAELLMTKTIGVELELVVGLALKNGITLSEENE